MDTRDKFLASAIAVIAALLVTCVLCNCYRDIKMAELGYNEVMLVGRDTPVWQKAR